MGFFSRLLGISRTAVPANPRCWRYGDGQVIVDLGACSELASKGGAVRLEGNNLPIRVLVVHGEDGGYHAFHNRCSHAGRRLDALPGQPRLECCSVGKSTFEYDGSKVSGSAKGPASALPVTEQNGRLYINLGRGAL
jgi:nitrite reductase/ring-hydroxylating ferredoxin subunit